MVAVTAFGLENSSGPATIMFFRDGVSEGEYSQVAMREIPAIQGMIKAANDMPTRTMCISWDRRCVASKHPAAEAEVNIHCRQQKLVCSRAAFYFDEASDAATSSSGKFRANSTLIPGKRGIGTSMEGS
ncbi:hypothetical protein BDN71DRAFT_1439595 [Pleurotus eryngii]|uniref:Piwi domain-containing protein n=1 Tax=Pleurotus eryngii TaxID=5323 RepID=A0A9P6A6X3_PLEER|nr:hypothetical protein BDN71DRAFT_1439595 [Pleurotus eryngii]